MRGLMLFAALALGLAQPAAAQVAYPPVVGASQAEVDAAKASSMQANTKADAAATAAAQAKAAADTANAAAAAACQPMAILPPVEVPGGTTGSGANCRLVNAADNRISRTAVFSYTANGAVLCGGSTTCTWSTPLPAGAASYPVFVTAIGATGAPSIRCKVASSSNTGFVGMTCTQASASIVLGGLVELSTGLTPGQIFVLSLPSTQASQ